jgi:hypothetical protein
MAYLRIEKNKFWGWVVVSALIGLLVGIALMFALGSSTSAKVATLQKQLTTQSEEASASLSDLQGQLASSEASLATLTAQNSQLASDLATAKAKPKTTTSTTSTGTVTFVSRSVSPSNMTTKTATMKLVVKVKGHPTKVQMRVVARTSGVTFDNTYNLTRVAHTSTSETWQRTVNAPKKKGDFRFYAYAFIGSKKWTMPGVSAWLFTVK